MGCSSSSSNTSALRLRDGVDTGDSCLVFLGVAGSEGGGEGSVDSGIRLYSPSLDRKSCSTDQCCQANESYALTGMPILVLMPAPVTTSTLCEAAMISAISCKCFSSPRCASINGMSTRWLSKTVDQYTVRLSLLCHRVWWGRIQIIEEVGISRGSGRVYFASMHVTRAPQGEKLGVDGIAGL
jgi:hypothetical protein